MATQKTSTKKVESSASEAQLFSMDGKLVKTIALPAEIFGAPWRPDLVHQVTTAIQANNRQNRAHTKDRSEVSGGGKKPWKQKGTGRARHGSTRSPIWRHGGVALGPRSARDYSEKVNKKMRRAALYSALSKKAAEGEVLFVDALSFAAPKTADAKRFVTAVAKAGGATLAAKKNAALVAFSAYDANKVKSFRNIGNLATEEVRNLNALAVLSHKYLVIENPEAAFAALKK
ncbi:MAG: 50S ribosomal protein L4 [Patescibacteria group bacterium]|nr:50S ribosomal protein L4 [Patescibacteria group bacterium]MDE1945395.1 50S ribosomal protein L4 [Patescibacteria group bacterium]MDE2057463.1 50S ribosomal protein L4 [Patescibacteria group bacterium]